jgi:hypothetical protein
MLKQVVMHAPLPAQAREQTEATPGSKSVLEAHPISGLDQLRLEKITPSGDGARPCSAWHAK